MGDIIILKKLVFLPKLISLFDTKERIEFIFVMIATFAMAFFQALGIASIIPFMNFVMNPESIHDSQWIYFFYSRFGFEGTESFVFFLGFLMLSVIIIGNVISAIAVWLKIRFVWKKNHNLSSALLKKYLSLPYDYFLNHNSADLSKNILAEVNQLTSHLLMPLLNIVIKGVMVLFVFAMLLVVDFLITIFAVIILGGSYALIYSRLRHKLRESGKKRLQSNQERFKAVDEAIGGVKILKLMGREPFFAQKYVTNSKEFTSLQSWANLVGQLPRYLLEIIAFGGVVALILILISREGSIGQVIPKVSFFAFAGYRLMPALQEIFSSFTKMNFIIPVLDRIHKDMNGAQTDTSYLRKINEKQLQEPLLFQRSINLEEISFSYPNTSENVLKNINLEIKRNTSIAIVGSTGSGKTTLIDVILGLLFPQEGKLIVDGTEITEDNVESWQRIIGYVPQQIYLSDDTIRRNIAFGLSDEDIDNTELVKAAKIANLHDFIVSDLPKGYETLVGERGIRLSGGQMQRVGIARALYYDPEVIVMDEATSSLDGITEEAVLEAMKNAVKLKTSIIIAHRLTTVMNCDVIYLIDKGRIVAEGTYDELMKSNRQFRSMAKSV